ncbi:MAG: OmpA family protein, partial [Myxococcota bacterium]
DGLGDVCDRDADGDGFADDLTAAGGGCSVSRRGQATALVMVLGLLLAMWTLGLRRRIAVATLAALLGMIALTGPARADRPVAVERFRLAADGQGILGVEWGDVPAHLSWNMGLWVGMADDPLVIIRDIDGASERVGALVASRVGASVTGALAVKERLQLGVDIPFILAQDQDRIDGVMTADISGYGLGDIRLIPKLQLLGTGRAGVALAVIAGVTVPTSSGTDYRGQSSFSFAPELVLSRAFGAVRLSSNFGYRTRDAIEFINLAIDNELFASVGAGYRFAESGGPPVQLDLTVSAATAASPPLGASNQDHLELLAGASYDFDGPLLGVLAGGLGVNEGFGTPDWRVILGVRLSGQQAGTDERLPDRDRDGLADAIDACPGFAEDADGFEDEDGCPDLSIDSDGDGLLDSADRCPALAEDMDGFADEDGCPDPDNDGDGIIDADDSCVAEAGTRENRGCPDGDSDGDTVIDRLDNCPDEPGLPANQGCTEKQRVMLDDGELRILDTVYFETDRAEIRPRSFDLLRNVARVLGAHTEITLVQIEGHTDDRGNDRYNRDLSQRRAESVMRFLVAEGVDSLRLRARGFGESSPIDSNATQAGRAANRRVEFKILDSAGAPRR